MVNLMTGFDHHEELYMFSMKIIFLNRQILVRKPPIYLTLGNIKISS